MLGITYNIATRSTFEKPSLHEFVPSSPLRAAVFVVPQACNASFSENSLTHDQQVFSDYARGLFYRIVNSEDLL